MAQFSVNTTRLDPYKNFKFRLKWDGKYVAGISKVGSLKRTTEVVEHRSGGDPSTSPATGLSQYSRSRSRLSCPNGERDLPLAINRICFTLSAVISQS